jgi:hypothetical protein
MKKSARGMRLSAVAWDEPFYQMLAVEWQQFFSGSL